WPPPSIRASPPLVSLPRRHQEIVAARAGNRLPERRRIASFERAILAGVGSISSTTSTGRRPISLGIEREGLMKLAGKRVLVIGERDGVNAPAIEACVRSAGAEVLYAETLCFV